MKFYTFLQHLVRNFLRLFYRIEYHGLENISGDGYMICGNHISLLDPVLVAIAVPRMMRFMSKIELFRYPGFRWLIRKLGAFPVDRKKGNSGAIEQSVEILRGGEVLMIFPEGTRAKNGEMLPPKSGAALISHRAPAPILPVSIQKRKLLIRTHVMLSFGPKILPEELEIDEVSREALNNASVRIMERIRSGMREWSDA